MTNLGFAVCPIHPVLLADSQQNHNRLYMAQKEIHVLICARSYDFRLVTPDVLVSYFLSICGQSYDARILSSTVVISIDPSIYSSRPNTIHPAVPLFYQSERPRFRLGVVCRCYDLLTYPFHLLYHQLTVHTWRDLLFLPKRITANK